MPHIDTTYKQKHHHAPSNIIAKVSCSNDVLEIWGNFNDRLSRTLALVLWAGILARASNENHPRRPSSLLFPFVLRDVRSPTMVAGLLTMCMGAATTPLFFP
mmetsp:Transcript_22963/g.36897  ORF Transcript_22963/g.36897 Transcript_22963/m.36897 type:complete len:102 (+) Transcript_22963:144-449(+)